MPAERYFVEVPGGAEVVALAELKRRGVGRAVGVPGGFIVEGRGAATRAAAARTVLAVYLTLTFDVPRPKALLGDATLRRLIGAVRGVGAGARFSGLRLSAAGADSATFQRLAAQLAAAVGVEPDPADGDLLVRVRPAAAASGWEVLVRLSPRPASARTWRVCNRPGGLNAAVGAVMNELVGGGDGSAYLNLMCGSGTLLIERALLGPAARLVGFDLDPEAVACAGRNAAAAGVAGRCELLVGDVTDDRFVTLLGAAGGFDALAVDAPWGDAVGAHAANRRLYPLLLEAAARLATPGATLCLLSHEVKLTRQVVAGQSAWTVARELQVAHGGHNPLLLALTRRT